MAEERHHTRAHTFHAPISARLWHGESVYAGYCVHTFNYFDGVAHDPIDPIGPAAITASATPTKHTTFTSNTAGNYSATRLPRPHMLPAQLTECVCIPFRLSQNQPPPLISTNSPHGVEIKIPGVGATPVAISTTLPAAVVQLNQLGKYECKRYFLAVYTQLLFFVSPCFGSVYLEFLPTTTKNIV